MISQLLFCTCLLMTPAQNMPTHMQAAVAEFRAKVLAPLMADVAADSKFWGRPVKFDAAAFTKRVNALTGQQLTYTLGNLPPANAVHAYKVAYTVSPGDAASVGKHGSGSGLVHGRTTDE
jgi:hypothetical protein